MLEAIETLLMTILSFSKTVYWCILSSWSNCYSAYLSTSFLLSCGPITVQSLPPLITRF